MKREHRVICATFRKRRRNFLQRIQKTVQVLSKSSIDALKEPDGTMRSEVLKEHISGLFPYILLRVTEGLSIPEIAAELGLKAHILNKLLQSYPLLREKIRRAREIRRDRVELAKMLE
jgi:hypothetical protein